jgi:hypothetical protein
MNVCMYAHAHTYLFLASEFLPAHELRVIRFRGMLLQTIIAVCHAHVDTERLEHDLGGHGFATHGLPTRGLDRHDDDDDLVRVACTVSTVDHHAVCDRYTCVLRETLVR